MPIVPPRITQAGTGVSRCVAPVEGDSLRGQGMRGENDELQAMAVLAGFGLELNNPTGSLPANKVKTSARDERN